MNDTEKELIYKLSKKGRDSYDHWDRLLIAANPVIKQELEKLDKISLNTYQADRIARQRKTAELKKMAEKQKGYLLSISLPTVTAACFLLVFGLFFINQNVRNHQILGDSIRLFIHSATEPERGYKKGDAFKNSDKFRLTFLPQGKVNENENYKGILFSIDSKLESVVYYRHDSDQERLSETKVTEIKETVHLKPDIEYIYFFIIFSEQGFSEEELIERTKELIRTEGLQIEPLPAVEFKDKVWDYIYLISGD